MRTAPPAVAAAFALLATLSCTPRSAGPPGGGDGGTQAGRGGSGSSNGTYDPRKDPLVNPPSLFEPPPDDPSRVETGDTLYRLVEGNPASLNPLMSSSTIEFYLNGAMYAGPFTFYKTMEFGLDHDVTESLEESPDHLTFTLRMKPGLTWQDGHPFNAHDIVFSYEQLKDERVPAPAARTGIEDVAECVALDDLTVRFRVHEAKPTSIWDVYFNLLPKHLYEKDKEAHPDLNSGEYYTELNLHPVGNGPYRFVEWVANEKVVLERWDGFWGKKAPFKRMVFRVVPDANNRLLTFAKGEVDEFRLQPLQVATQTDAISDFARIGGVKCWGPEWTYEYIVWNQDGRNPFFGDRRVRYAMTHATNIPRMISELTYNLYAQARGPYHPDSWMFDPSTKLLAFDLEVAGRLLDEAGWRIDTSREGWRYKEIEGVPVRFEFTMLSQSNSFTAPKVIAILQEDLQSIGVKMEVQAVEFATWQERARKHEFQGMMGVWGTGVDPDLSKNLWSSKFYDPTGGSGRNYGAYRNARVDELFDAGAREFDKGRRKAVYQEIGRLIYEDQPYTFLWNRAILWAIQGRIRGVQMSPRGVFNFDPADLGWWVPAGAGKHVADVP
jgi:peptide/nickel transport system substrate-binding protein